MSSSSTVEQLKEKLLRCLDDEKNVNDMAAVLPVFAELETASISRELLEATRLGLLINEIRRKNQETYPDLARKCRNLIKEWQKLITASTAAANATGRLGVSPSPSDGTNSLSSAPGSRTTTPRQTTAAARIIADSGLRCSPSPALTPRQRQTMVNGGGSRLDSHKTLSPQLASASAVATSSYAPPSEVQQQQQQQQPQTNGPSSLKIRIKYGSAERQASIVRELEPSSDAEPSGNGNTANLGSEEASNRRKRKAPSTEPPTNTDLVNGGRKSVSPNTPVNSPCPDVGGGVNTKNAKTVSPNLMSSVEAATISQRPKLKSTAELVAEMTSNYPENMSINLKNVIATPASPPQGAGTSILASVLAAGESDHDDSDDDDYTESGYPKLKNSSGWTATIVPRALDKNELLDRYLQDHSMGGETVVKRRRGRPPKSETLAMRALTSAEAIREDKRTTQTTPAWRSAKPTDWYAVVDLPPLDYSVLADVVVDDDDFDQVGVCDKKPPEEQPASSGGKLLDVFNDCEPGTSNGDLNMHETETDARWRSRMLETVRENRQILAMPYVDIGLPDFLEYRYSDQQQFLAHWSER